ncbi:hypothetical protein LQ327_30705 [Actinomycetospora endophytica]|uniref:Uncharacterized protein n=1 Tax=Actinomycetospora endophytica TaxID=2291215 RepID=A0ABS8PJR2_9PSEU|nr:hypothetical protein [Actinomycetospora endophytica]MCD2197750.1 hypothetical protein [Actinomycetospora endophytica]
MSTWSTVGTSESTRPREEIIVHLGSPDELLAVDPLAPLHAPAGVKVRGAPGVDEILGELLGRPRVRRSRRVVLTLPTAALDDTELPGRLETGLRRWCAARTERIERESRAQWRQGLWALRSGLALFVIGLVLSTELLQPDVPQFLQDLLGNGVFSVIAWIGLWYPLDLLFFARSPAKREMRALDALATLPVVVRARP